MESSKEQVMQAGASNENLDSLDKCKIPTLDEEWNTLHLGYNGGTEDRVFNVVTVLSGDDHLVDERRLANVFKLSKDELEDNVRARIRK